MTFQYDSYTRLRQYKERNVHTTFTDAVPELFKALPLPWPLPVIVDEDHRQKMPLA